MKVSETSNKKEITSQPASASDAYKSCNPRRNAPTQISDTYNIPKKEEEKGT
jgi:hypothetical protein